MFGTESDPATPWDPAVHARKRAEDALEDEKASEEEERNPEYPLTASYVTIVPDYEYPAYSTHFDNGTQDYPKGAPSYPWGMPMSPVNVTVDGTYDTSPLQVPGGPGVMWTPTGWAVQDAAMKMALFKAETGTNYMGKGRGEYVPKIYWRSEFSYCSSQPSDN